MTTEGEMIHVDECLDLRSDVICLVTSYHSRTLMIFSNFDPLNERLHDKPNESRTWQNLHFLLPLVNSFLISPRWLRAYLNLKIVFTVLVMVLTVVSPAMQVCRDGAQDENRTHDLRITSALLYP
jgi:hypothetical protein